MKVIRRKVKGASPLALLLLLYVGFSSLRIALSFCFSQNPSIMPDEALYLNLARSLWSASEVSLRGQPVTFDSLLYPLVLSPLLALPKEINLFRAIQIANALLINTAIFPAFALARRVCRSERAAFAVAAFTPLMPGFAMTEIIMAENITSPLLLLALYQCYRALADRKERDAALAGVCCFLLFCAKSGMIAVFAALCALLFIRGIKNRDAATLVQAVSALIAFLSMFLCWRLITTRVFGMDYQQKSIYALQTQPFSIAHLLQSMNGLPLYLLFCPLSCAIFPVLVPLSHRKKLTETNRLFAEMVLLSMLLIIVGICYIIYMDEYTGDPFAARVHLRYLEGFTPVSIALALSPALKNSRMNGAMFAGLSFLLVGIMVFTTGAVLSGNAYPVDALSLAVMTETVPWTDLRKVSQLFFPLAILCGGYFLCRYGWTRRMRAILFGALATLMVINNACGYDQLRHNTDARWAQDAMQAHAEIGEGTMLSIAQDEDFFWNAQTTLDMHARKAFMTVCLDDIARNTPAGGAYAPFQPQAYWVTRAANRTPDATALVMDASLLSQIVLADPASVSYTAHGCYAIIPIRPGKAWVHSAFSGLNEGWVQEGSGLSVFDSALCGKDELHIWLRARAGEGTAMLTATHGGVRREFGLGDTLEWVEMTIPVVDAGEVFRMGLSASLGNVFVETYLVE